MRLFVKGALILALTGSLFSAAPVRAQQSRGPKSGAVFVMTNSADHNQIISFRRNEDGSLSRARTFATAGRGSGGVTDPLESQGSLTLSKDHSLLFAVNAGSSEISVFRVFGTDLFLVDKKTTGGAEPNAVAQFGNLVYVLNVGGSSNVIGFRLNADGRLNQIRNSIRFLTTNNSEGASLAFSPDGRFLLVTERATGNIDAFQVQGDGTLSPILVNTDSSPGLFSLVFAPSGVAIVSETGPAGGNNASTVSSYAVRNDGTIVPISTALPTFGAANCWNIVTPDGHFVYVSNAGSATISGFAIGPDGALTAIGPTVLGINPSGSTNLDVAVSADSRFLYSVNSGTGAIGIFGIQQDGTLTNEGRLEGLPANAGFNGIAAF